MDLVIGTAQAQQGYGIKDNNQCLKHFELEKILAFSKNNSITRIDTSPGYGDAEKSLGRNDLHGFGVLTKLSAPLTENAVTMRSLMKQSIETSLKDLNVTELEGVAIHNFEMLHIDAQQLALETLEDLKYCLPFQKIGISIYHPESLEKNTKPELLDYIQAPVSFVDQRFLNKKCQKILDDNNISLHARSVFLQGLLLMNFCEQSLLFPKFKEIWYQLECFVHKHDQSRLSVCLNFVNHCESIEKIVIGVKSLDQLISLHKIKDVMVKPIFSTPVFDDNLLLPFNWKQK